MRYFDYQCTGVCYDNDVVVLGHKGKIIGMISRDMIETIALVDIPEENNNEKENENMITLKELLSHLESEARIVDKGGITVVTGDPSKLKIIISDDILNTSVKYIDSYDDSRTKVVLDMLLKTIEGDTK